MATLLVIDDEPSLLQLFRRVFEKSGLQVATADSGAEGLRQLQVVSPDVVLLDIVLPDQSGLELFQQIHERDPKLPVIFITGTGASDTAIEAIKLGALDYLVKPLDFAQVRKLVDQALEIRRLMKEPVRVSAAVVDEATGDILVGRCPAMQLVYKAIGRVASQNVTVLIRGESGTGKELVARALYHHSNRAKGPFMAVNSAAIPEALLESELFGHERGSFTGADRKRIGKFEQCNGGTLFLDEIGDMSPALQAKILRALQEQRFERIGGSETIATDVRVIAATNRNLEQMVAENQFRGDLYYRLNGYTIKLPPLRKRGDDLQLLVDHFLARANREFGKNITSIAPAALTALQRYSWPGNVRELQSTLRQAVLQTTGEVLLLDFLPDNVLETPREQPPESGDDAAPLTDDESDSLASAEDAAFWDRFFSRQLAEGDNLYDRSLLQMEFELLSRVLRHTEGNQAEAAKLLGMTRTTLRTKIRQARITIDKTVHTGES